MAVMKDWAQEAANEIADNVRSGDGNEEDYRAIIIKHCPFKPDVAYMPVLSALLVSRRQEQDVGEGMTSDWREAVARRIILLFDLKAFAPQDTSIPALVSIIEEHCPFKPDVAYEEVVAKEPPLLQCIDCKNTESPAGAMARYFNQGRCLHCGGYFRVVRA
jgi:hypothetical protein